MGRWTYYSPGWLGAVFAVLAHDLYGEALPAGGTQEYWASVVGVALAFGLLCQLTMLGAQGALGQVLPVPGGRTIRGRGATATGWLILLSVALAAVTGLLRWEAVSLAANVFAGAAGLAAAGALGVYAWSWPTAVRDFDESMR